MNIAQKRGALLFFGKAGCVSCHAVSGQSNEMFSDFEMHVAGVPQIAPYFGFGEGNVIFDGLGEDEDFGLEQITGDSGDRYKFRDFAPSERGATTGVLPQWCFHKIERCDSLPSGRVRLMPAPTDAGNGRGRS